ncbi:DUF5959 family protein [Streptomyces sp. NBC_01136]|uniref:DUF5959 family protein n=1 Tax=unclassified Streptomyces TaxID=2593676 RepID=UPI0032434E7C|nr:DUF5959 family protein [Streptomyces sp. NBC_01136]
MSEPEPVDLIHLSDTEGNRCIVRVTRRFQPGILTGHDILCADVLASASFVDARLDLYLFQHDLAAWELQLDHLELGGKASIGGDRGLSLGFHLHEDHSVTVAVDDPARLTTMLWIRPAPDWIEEHRRRLAEFRQTWPSEVTETAPMVYMWSPNRSS